MRDRLILRAAHEKEAGDAPENVQLFLDRLEHERQPDAVLVRPRLALPFPLPYKRDVFVGLCVINLRKKGV